jgi:hypothetical protein
MRFLTALRLGFHRLHRRPSVVLFAYLAALVPALLIASLVRSDFAASLDDSLFAGQVFAGNRFGVVIDFLASSGNDLKPILGGLGVRILVMLLVQIAVSAGIVEVLLGATARERHPFLLGIGHHTWRFLRTAFWFLLSLAVAAGALGMVFKLAADRATEAGDGSLLLAARIGLLVVVLFGFGPFKLAYDLARVAAAAHGDGRTLVGFFRAFGHCLRRPAILLPLYLTFALLAVALYAGVFAARDLWSPPSPLFVVALFAAQQAVLLLRAYLRGGLWASEIAYYQAIGEPRWCRRRTKAK